MSYLIALVGLLVKKISQNSKFLHYQQLPPRLLQTIIWIVVVGNKKGDVKIVFSCPVSMIL